MATMPSESTGLPVMNEACSIEWKQMGRSLVQLTVRMEDRTIDVDKIDVSRASARSKYIDRLSRQYPGINQDDLTRRLLSIAGELSEQEDGATTASHSEVEVSSLARCELFHTPEVSGILVPATVVFEGKPTGRWLLHLRWNASNLRECRDLSESIDLPDGTKLWLHPIPALPTPSTRSGWTADSRRDWLEGGDAPNAAKLFQRVCERFAYYLEFIGETAQGDLATLALWTMLTYVYPCWTAVPYLSIGGPLGSGKSRLFELLSRMVFRPLQSSNTTAACLFRTLHESGGVLLLDEAERLRDSTPDAGEIRSILLSGYKAGSPAMRLEPTTDGKYRSTSFDVFGPKAIAGIARLPEALSSRCIRLTMFRATQGSEKPRRRVDENPATWASIRNQLHVLAIEHGPTWRQLSDRADVCPTMMGRDYELWQPLLALAAFVEENGADGLLRFMQDYAETAIEMSRDDSTPDADELLLRLLADSVTAGTQGHVTPGELLKRAREREPGFFDRWSPRGVAATLKRYKIMAIKTGGRRVYRDTTLHQLAQIQMTYGLDLGLATDPTVPTAPRDCHATGEPATERGTVGSVGSPEKGYACDNCNTI